MSILTGGFLKGKKTYLTAGVGIITLVVQYLTGEIDLIGLTNSSIPLLGLFFARMGINKNETK